MPPVRFKAPQQVRIRCPKGRIVPLNEPDIKIGKTVVAAAPHRITAEQLEQARRTLRRCSSYSLPFVPIPSPCFALGLASNAEYCMSFEMRSSVLAW